MLDDDNSLIIDKTHYLYRFAELREQKAFKIGNVTDLLSFTVDTHKRMFNETFIVKPFHEEVTDLLTKFAYRQIPDKYILVLNMPFRYSKTQILIYYMMWCFLKNEMARFIYTTYAEKLSLKTSREVKKGLIDIYHRKSTFSKDAAHLWETRAGGGLWATTMQGSVTGFGAGDLASSPCGGDLIIDDPISPANCFYETKRNTVNENIVNTFWSRRNQLDRTPIILNMQRLHPKDASNYLLEKYPDSCVHYILKGLDDNDEPTFPERVSKKTLLELKQSSSYTFYSQVQQQPQEYTGGFFLIDQTQIISTKEWRDKEWLMKFYVRSWDFAGVKKETKPNEKNDYTRGVWCCTDGEFFYILDLQSHHGTVEQNEILLCQTANRDGWKTTITVPEDPGVSGQHYVSYLQMLPELGGYSLNPIRPTINKQLRAAPFASLLNMGKVIIVSDDEDKEKWNSILLAELAAFPYGIHDDIVDALSDAFFTIHSVKHYL